MTQLTKAEFNLLPTTFQEAQKFSEIICNSSFCPAGFRGKPNDVLIAIQMGREVGLQPLQALQNIAVINGKPSIYGDAMLAICRMHPDFEWIKEEIIGEEAICIIKRRGNPEIMGKFSITDAKKAGLWGKQGPWTTYGNRMLQMRARGFALRDAFPDALKGLISSEEAQDDPIKDITPKKSYQKPVPVDVLPIETSDVIDISSLNQEEDIDPPSRAKPSDASINTLMDLVVATETPRTIIDKWLSAAQANDFDQMTQEQINACIEKLKKQLKEKET